MIPIEPFNIFAYVNFRKRAALPNGVKSKYFLSWEDTLWELIQVNKIPRHSKVLVPSFWCTDVIHNMENHDLRCVTYQVDESFQSSEKIIIDAVMKHKPQVVVVFHAVGIRNRLLTETVGWLATLDEKCILIEDSVHSTISPSEVSFVRSNHFIIDSWRKVVPLQGSALYYRESDLSSNSTQTKTINFHMLVVVSLWFLMQVTLTLQKHTQKYFARPLGLLAERLKLWGYEIIGDTTYSSRTLGLFVQLSQHLAVDEIRQIKKHQVEIYDRLVGDIIQNNKKTFPIWRRYTDHALMRAYPIGLTLPFAGDIIKKLRSSGLLVRSELDQSPWSQNNKVIFLPLGPQLSDVDIRKVCDVVIQSLNTIDATMLP